MAVLELRTSEPSSPDQLIGESIRSTTQALLNSADAIINGDYDPLAIVLTGQPGIGKTTIANMLAVRLTGSAYACSAENGKEVGVQRVRDMMEKMHESTLFSLTGHQVWIINEGDKISDDGQVAFLSLLDSCPSHYHIILTSNMELDSWSERFQSRFESYELSPPEGEEIVSGLVDRLKPSDTEGWEETWQEVVEQAVSLCNGNVRQAIKDINSWKRKNQILS